MYELFPLLTDGSARAVSSPGPGVIEDSLTRLHQLDLAVATFSKRPGILIEASATIPEAFVLRYRESREAQWRSSRFDIGLPVVLDIFESYRLENDSWRTLVSWRKLHWPRENTPQMSGVRDWVAGLWKVVKEDDSDLSNEQTNIALRKIMREEAKQAMGRSVGVEAIESYAWFDLECLFLETLADLRLAECGKPS